MTVAELLDRLKADEGAAGEACMASEGSQGCDKANELAHVIGFIERYLDIKQRPILDDSWEPID
jgi:hypothetical protein